MSVMMLICWHTHSDERAYLNPHLPFGGADIPREGFSYKLKQVGRRAPEGSRVRIDYRWK